MLSTMLDWFWNVCVPSVGYGFCQPVLTRWIERLNAFIA